MITFLVNNSNILFLYQSVSNMDLLLQNEDFISETIKLYISKTKLIHTVLNSNFQIHVYSKTKNKKLIEYINICSDRITKIIKHYDLKKFLEIYIIDCPEKRLFRDDPHYINGGLTFPNLNQIIVYRKKELSKVLIHEVLHHIYSFEHSMITNNCIEINPNEAIIEFLATIWQLKLTNSSIQKEKQHSKINSQKVLFLLKDKDLHKSNIYSYIVVKHILMLHSKKVLEYLKNNKFKNIYDIIYNYKLNIKPHKVFSKEELRFVLCSNL